MAEPRLDQAAHRVDAERPEPLALQAPGAERALEPERVGLGERRADGGEHADREAVQAPDGERQRPRGRGVEPLHVVDREHERARLGRAHEQRAEAGADRGGVGRLPGARAPDERDLERVALRAPAARSRKSSAIGSARSARPTNDSRASACSATQRSTR